MNNRLDLGLSIRATVPGSRTPQGQAAEAPARGLDLPMNVTTTTSASVRRSIAHQIQRDQLRG
ncbi:hypothetical protein [Streptomyces zhihengii]|uniref:hypothetical protein n=1 Tax=Streptomyces zhihengii TaxID=1818004 RepID=UPI0033B234C9